MSTPLVEIEEIFIYLFFIKPNMDILNEIFCFLSRNELDILKSVCKQWSTIFDEENAIFSLRAIFVQLNCQHGTAYLQNKPIRSRDTTNLNYGSRELKRSTKI